MVFPFFPIKTVQAALLAFVMASPLLVNAAPQPRSATPPASPAMAIRAPKLTVVIVVDQLRGAEIEDAKSLWREGMLRLTQEGRWYTQAYHGHGRAETAAGHACIGTGVHPKWHGVVDKVIYSREQDATLSVCEFGPGMCDPDALLVPTLGDRLKRVDPQAKVVSIAQKARSAMLMGGKNTDLMVWDESVDEPTLQGWFQGARGVPAWLQADYRQRVPNAKLIRAGKTKAPVWELPVLPAPYAQIPDANAGEVGCGIDTLDRAAAARMPRDTGTTFPHQLLPADHGKSFYRSWHCTPDSDQAITDITLRAMKELQLGKDDHPDLLWMSLSAIDVAGHHFGYESLERPAGLVALDRTLGQFIQEIIAWVGSPNDVVIALTADHGVGPRIDTLHAQGKPAGRVGVAEIQQLITDALDADPVLHAQISRSPYYGKLGPNTDRPLLAFTYPFVHLGYATRALRDRAAAITVAALKRHPAVLQAWPTPALEEAATRDPIAALMWENAHATRSGDVTVVFKPGFTPTHGDPNDPRGVDHGAPTDVDRHVPVLLWGRGITAQKIATPVAVIDLMRSVADTLLLPPGPHAGQPLP